jgi:NAD(P)H-quinone oxidoreductase subunit 6
MPIGALIFYLLATLTVGSAMMVAFSRNIVYSAFSLLGTLMGAAGLYAWLAADFVAVIQILVYIGGILVLIVFAVMLTHRIEDVAVSNRSVGRLPAAIIIGVVGILMGAGVMTARWAQQANPQAEPTTYGIGDAFLGQYILPFELASVVLLVVLIGAVVVSRKEIRGEAGSQS